MDRAVQRKQLFVSHTWQEDEEGRDTHIRARNLVILLEKLGWTVWFDENDMHSHIDAAMADGIDASDAVLLLLTRAYARKVNRESRRQGVSTNNVFKEFNYVVMRPRIVIPVVFEEAMRNVDEWSPGVMPMRLGSKLYIDGISEDLRATARKIDATLRREGCTPERVAPVLVRWQLVALSNTAAPTRAAPVLTRWKPPALANAPPPSAVCALL